MSNTAAIHQLMSKPVFNASEARRLGIYPSLLQFYIKKNLFERIGRGVYRSLSASLDVDFKWEDLVLTAKGVNKGIVCLISALSIYELTDEIAREFWIAIPHSTTAPIREGTKFIRMRDCTTGVTHKKIGKETIVIFDIERTIVDAFRYLSKEIAIKALKQSLKTTEGNKVNIQKLQQYAKKFRINLDPYILTVIT